MCNSLLFLASTTKVYDTHYYALRRTADNQYVLSYSESCKKVTDVDITKIAKEKLGPNANFINFKSITYLDNKFYITGFYRDKSIVVTDFCLIIVWIL